MGGRGTRDELPRPSAIPLTSPIWAVRPVFDDACWPERPDGNIVGMAALRDATHDRGRVTNLVGALTAVVLAVVLLSAVLVLGAYAVKWAWTFGG